MIAAPALPVRAQLVRRPPVPDVQVWSLDLADRGWDVARERATLTDAEADRADAGIPSVRRRRILLRAGLRRVLGGLLGLPADRVPLAVDRGRPYLTGPAGALQVSCSASGPVGLVAVVSGAAVGVDVQGHDAAQAGQAFAEDWLTPRERAGLAVLPTADRLVAVTRCWTQKEAVLKGLGVGLLRSPASVETPVSPSGRSGEWALAPVAVPAGHLAGIAVHTSSSSLPVRVAELTPERTR